MTSTKIETFSAEHLAGAAAVLSARHADHLAQSPLLAPGDARAALKDFWDKKGKSGAVAIRGGRVVGFVLAEIMAPRFSAIARGWRIQGTPPMTANSCATFTPPPPRCGLRPAPTATMS